MTDKPSFDEKLVEETKKLPKLYDACFVIGARWAREATLKEVCEWIKDRYGTLGLIALEEKFGVKE